MTSLLLILLGVVLGSLNVYARRKPGFNTAEIGSGDWYVVGSCQNSPWFKPFNIGSRMGRFRFTPAASLNIIVEYMELQADGSCSKYRSETNRYDLDGFYEFEVKAGKVAMFAIKSKRTKYALVYGHFRKNEGDRTQSNSNFYLFARKKDPGTAVKDEWRSFCGRFGRVSDENIFLPINEDCPGGFH